MIHIQEYIKSIKKEVIGIPPTYITFDAIFFVSKITIKIKTPLNYVTDNIDDILTKYHFIKTNQYIVKKSSNYIINSQILCCVYEALVADLEEITRINGLKELLS